MQSTRIFQFFQGLYMVIKNLFEKGGDNMKNVTFVKITPLDIKKKLLELFPEAKEVIGKDLVAIPNEIIEEFNIKHCYLRKIKQFQDKQVKKTDKEYDVLYELSFYRGEFDPEVNGYKIETVIPKVLFDRARKENLVFAVRFKSVLLEDKPEGVLFWYVNEKVSL